jgi:hypothetical protein
MLPTFMIGLLNACHHYSGFVYKSTWLVAITNTIEVGVHTCADCSAIRHAFASRFLQQGCTIYDCRLAARSLQSKYERAVQSS